MMLARKEEGQVQRLSGFPTLDRRDGSAIDNPETYAETPIRGHSSLAFLPIFVD
jgi:hypothetical protein